MQTSTSRVLLSESAQDYQQKFDQIHSGKYIGSSTIGAIAGLVKYKSPLQVWCEMTGRVSSVGDDNDYMWLGRHMEPIIGELFVRKTQHSAIRNKNIWQHGTEDWAIATPDFRVLDADQNWGLLETKNTSFRSAPFWEDGIPDYAHIQIQWQLGIVGFRKGWVAALIGADPSNFQVKQVDFDSTIFDQLMTLGHNFMQLVDSDTPPGALADDGQLIKDLIHQGEKVVNLENEYHELKHLLACQGQLKLHNAEVRKLTDEISKIKNNLLLKIKESGKGQSGEYMLTAVERTRAAYEAKPASWVELKIKNTKE